MFVDVLVKNLYRFKLEFKFYNINYTFYLTKELNNIIFESMFNYKRVYKLMEVLLKRIRIQ